MSIIVHVYDSNAKQLRNERLMKKGRTERQDENAFARFDHAPLHGASRRPLLDTSGIPTGLEDLSSAIVVLRGQKVLLDTEVAALYEVPTKTLNQAVRRNAGRFPKGFLFRLTRSETEILNRPQAFMESPKCRRLRMSRYAFAGRGIIMAAHILKSPCAVAMSIYVVRAFGRLREILASNMNFAQELDQLERKLQTRDHAIVDIIRVIRELRNGDSIVSQRSMH